MSKIRKLNPSVEKNLERVGRNKIQTQLGDFCIGDLKDFGKINESKEITVVAGSVFKIGAPQSIKKNLEIKPIGGGKVVIENPRLGDLGR